MVRNDHDESKSLQPAALKGHNRVKMTIFVSFEPIYMHS